MKKKNYQEAVEIILNDRKFKKNSSPDLTSKEKYFLKIRTLISYNQHHAAINKLNSLKEDNDYFLAQKFYLLSECYFSINEYEKSLCSNLEALHYFEKLNDSTYIFKTLYNISVDYNRLNLNCLSLMYIQKAQKQTASEQDQIMILRALACHYSKMENYQLATDQIKMCLKQLANMNRYDQKNTLLAASDIYFRSGKPQIASETLAQCVHLFDGADQARFVFESKLLKHFSTDSPLPACPESIASFKEFKLKWSLIQFLESGQTDLSHKTWNELKSLFPEIFGEFLNCIDQSEEKSLFFSYIKKTCKKPNSIKADVALSGKVKELFVILNSSKAPIRKEELIEKIWKVSYDPIFDQRLYKLIERLKKNYSIIQTNRAYILTK